MCKRLWAVCKSERGSQLLEFILVFPLLWFLFVFSLDQFSIVYNRQKALAAAYEAGRIASLQPNFGLASYHGQVRGKNELHDAIGKVRGEIEILPEGRWRKGNHFVARAILEMNLLASGRKVTVAESFEMMIENAGG